MKPRQINKAKNNCLSKIHTKHTKLKSVIKSDKLNDLIKENIGLANIVSDNIPDFDEKINAKNIIKNLSGKHKLLIKEAKKYILNISDLKNEYLKLDNLSKHVEYDQFNQVLDDIIKLSDNINETIENINKIHTQKEAQFIRLSEISNIKNELKNIVDNIGKFKSHELKNMIDKIYKRVKILNDTNVNNLYKKVNGEVYAHINRTFTNISKNDTLKISEQLWLPSSSQPGYNCKIYTDSWFINNKTHKNNMGYDKVISRETLENFKVLKFKDIFKISQNFCHPCNVYNDYHLKEITEFMNISKNENFNDIKSELNKVENDIKELTEKFNPLKKYKNNSKNSTNKKIIKFDPDKNPCKFTIVKTYNDTKYGRPCSMQCLEKLDYCKDHNNKTNDLKYDKLIDNLCQHILTQASGGKNGKDKVDRKGMKCNDFTFGSKNPSYCKVHEKKHNDELNNNQKTVLRSFKQRFYPSKILRDKLTECFGNARKTYNLCVENKMIEKYSEGEARKRFVTNVIKGKRESFYEKLLISKINEDEEGENIYDIKIAKNDYLKNTPKDIRAFEVSEYYKNIKNANDMYQLKLQQEEWKRDNLLKYKEEEIKKPVMGFKSKKDQQSINISKDAINIEEGLMYFYKEKIGKEPIKFKGRSKKDKRLQNILNKGIIYHDIRIIKTITNKYYVCFAEDISIEDEKLMIKVCAGDTGGRTFLTTFSENEVNEFGDDMKNTLMPLIKKRNELRKQYNKAIRDKIKKKNKTKKVQEEIVKKYRRARMRYIKCNNKITNMVNDMHYKVIAKLVSAYTLIFIPKLNMTKIMKNEDMSKEMKQMMQEQSHMRFLKRLENKCEEKGITMRIVNELMTTQTCGNCLSTKKFEGKIYDCEKCGIKMGRDINSARNLYIKEIAKIVEFTEYIKKTPMSATPQ